MLYRNQFRFIIETILLYIYITFPSFLFSLKWVIYEMQITVAKEFFIFVNKCEINILEHIYYIAKMFQCNHYKVK